MAMPVPEFSTTLSTRWEACHTVLGQCRTDADCCDSMRCDFRAGEGLCAPSG
ncbi:hypothetical protein GQ53DRAFT_826191 [Thozetella sp. PMI_491]|nr:hypothetical protein GQ53DRAFT_826191 [Thozetella sp. PMI_491]